MRTQMQTVKLPLIQSKEKQNSSHKKEQNLLKSGHYLFKKREKTQNTRAKIN